MKTFKVVMNVLGIIAASVLSIFLVGALIVTSFMSGMSSFFKTETLKQLMEKFDISEMIVSEMSAEDAEISGEFFEKFMETEMMDEVVELCIDNLFSVIMGESTEDGLTEEDIIDVAEEHMDEIEALVDETLADELDLSDDEVSTMAEQIIEEYALGIAETFPSAEELGMDHETLQIIKSFRNGTFFWIMFAIVAVLTVIVMLCQVMRFKGFMWIGVDYAVAAVGTLILAVLMKGIGAMALSTDNSFDGMMSSFMISIFSSEMMKCAAVEIVLAIVFIVIFVVGRKNLKKKVNTLQMYN